MCVAQTDSRQQHGTSKHQVRHNAALCISLSRLTAARQQARQSELRRPPFRPVDTPAHGSIAADGHTAAARKQATSHLVYLIDFRD